MPVQVVYPHRRHLSRRVQAFMAWVAELLSERSP
jgi:DNA-binding transcriptional LysR family regulator